MPERSSPLFTIWRGLLDLVYPPRCVGCQRPGAWFCPDCLAQVTPVPVPICLVCGTPLLHGDLCRACRRAPLEIDGIRSVGLHQGALRHAIHGLKYRRQRDLVGPLAGLLAAYLNDHPLPADVLVPVPLHRERQRERGYNQSALLARGIAGPELPVVEDALVRLRPTAVQMTLGRDERRQNVAGAFGCRDGALRGRRVLLIDDVCTTGATLEACAAAARQGGAASVWALTLSRESGGLVGRT